jgi:serine/threonine protein kinase
MQSNLPDTIGRYEVLSRLGRGGMGVVYRGRDPRIGGRFVAIKLLHVSEDGPVDRFLQEAATAGVLDHPNIVKVYDFGEHLGDPFIVMEFVEGVTLAELIRTRSPLSLARKLEVIRDVAIGLDYAHNMGVVHRDVKPANLMIRSGGSVKILDFGIARVANTGMTQAGDQLGTPNYMSPEQIDGTPVDRRSDVFGLGLVFYELLALRRAFSGEGIMQVMAQILHQSPEPIDRVCLNLDPAIARIVHTAIEKDPARRYQSLAALAKDVDDIRRRMRGAGDESGGTHPDLSPRDPASETITGILRQARRDFESGNFASAVRAASEILARDPSNDAARSLSREALAALDELRTREEFEKHARRTIEAQEEAFRKGQIKEALAALDQFTPRHSLVTAAAARLRAEAEEIELRRRSEEQRRLAQARWAAGELETARESVKGHRFGEAIATLEHLKQVSPDLAEVDGVLAQARAGLAAAAADSKRRRDVADLVERADREERGNRLEDARRSFQSALQLEPSHAEALAGSARIEASMKRALDEHRRRAERERHTEATVRAALAQSDAGAHSAALLLLDALDEADTRVLAARSVIAPRVRAAEAATRARAAEAQRRDQESLQERTAEQVEATVVRGSSTHLAKETAPLWKGKGYVTAAAVVVLLAGVGYVWNASSRRVVAPPIHGNSELGAAKAGKIDGAAEQPKGKPKASEPTGLTPSPSQTVNPPASTNPGRAGRNQRKVEQKAGRETADAASAPASPVTTASPTTGPPIVPILPPASPPVVAGSGVGSPASPPAPARPPALGVDQAVAVLNDFGKRFVKFDVKDLQKLYPEMTKRQQDFLAKSKDLYRDCALTFSAPQIAGPVDGHVSVIAAAVLTCKARSGSPPPNQSLNNTFTLRSFENGWQVVNWYYSIR